MGHDASLLPIRIRILALLARNPTGLNGYQLGARLEVPNGSLYPALARLVGAAQVRLTPQHDGSKIYTLTDLGIEQLGRVREELAPASEEHAAASAAKQAATSRRRYRRGEGWAPAPAR